MSFLDRLFGRKRPEPPQAPPLSPPPSSAPAAPGPGEDGGMIRMFDGYGQQILVTRDEWRTRVLPHNLRAQWNNPDALYGIILGAVGDGFHADVVEAAEQLRRIDPIPERGACILGIVLTKNGRLDEAEDALRGYAHAHGESGVVLTNLAKVQAERGDHAQAEATLWHALELDPNQDNGLLWYEVIHRERDGRQAGLDALRRIAALPESWRAQLWLARAALEAGDRAAALALYAESLSRMGTPAPADALMQISGDLGERGLGADAIALVGPRFDAATHGLHVGNNLIKAHLDLGMVPQAHAILEELHALRRPDWGETLGFWEGQIAQARIDAAPAPGEVPVEVSMVMVEGPLWLPPDTPGSALFSSADADGPVIAFVGASAEKGVQAQEVEMQLADAPGRMSRALPLFLAEQAALAGSARVRTLTPWVGSTPGAFALLGFPWSDEDAAGYARGGPTPAGYAVVTHVLAQSDPWTVQLRLLRVADGECIGQLSAPVPAAQPGDAVRTLAGQLLAMLAARAEVRPPPPSPLYRLPEGGWLADYLLRLEQLLTLRCQERDGDAAGLSGEREIMGGNLRLCLAFPDQVPVRMLLAYTVRYMARIRPAVAAEFRDRVLLLQREHPLPPEPHAAVQAILDEALGS